VLKAHDDLFAVVVRAVGAVLQPAFDGARANLARSAVANPAALAEAAIAYAILGPEMF
jgi:hypothetical protein